MASMCERQKGGERGERERERERENTYQQDQLPRNKRNKVSGKRLSHTPLGLIPRSGIMGTYHERHSMTFIGSWPYHLPTPRFQFLVIVPFQSALSG